MISRMASTEGLSQEAARPVALALVHSLPVEEAGERGSVCQGRAPALSGGGRSSAVAGGVKEGGAPLYFAGLPQLRALQPPQFRRLPTALAPVHPAAAATAAAGNSCG